ncbi:MAG: SpoIVB peptidase [Lachnospiraceae bacterium]|nr:SpoIVB peptidase [Lachnospiraceae bacterium]
MKLWVSESERIKKQAGDEAVVILEAWKKRVLRLRIYRWSLIGALSVSSVALAGFVLYSIDSSIPSTIHIRANEEQSFDLGVPAKAEIISVSEQGKSNIPKGAVTIDLSEAVTMKAAENSNYQMEVKLFGFLPFKQVGISVIQEEELIPVGKPVGIYVKTDGILVIGVGEFQGEDGMTYSPADNILKSGDYIQKLNGEPVSEKNDFIDKIEQCKGQEQVITLERNGELMDVRVQPRKNQYGFYKIGTWVRDNTQGVGTMTYIDSQGNFGALGHGINDVDTSTLLDTNDGTLYETEIVSIRKGENGTPGEMTGMIMYTDSRILGDITENTERGLFGVCNQKAMGMATANPLPIAFKQEIQEGYAQIISTVDGTTQYYDIEITGVRLDNNNINRGIELTITDPELLTITGGIVQGMFTSYNGSNNRKASKIKGFLMF